MRMSGLELADHRDELVRLPLVSRAFPLSVEPEQRDLAVVGEQLADLSEHDVEVGVPRLRAAAEELQVRLVLLAERRVVRVVPVGQRVVEADAQTRPRARRPRTRRRGRRRSGVCAIEKSVCLVGHSAKPSWCFVVRIAYRMPASRGERTSTPSRLPVRARSSKHPGSSPRRRRRASSGRTGTPPTSGQESSKPRLTMASSGRTCRTSLGRTSAWR